MKFINNPYAYMNSKDNSILHLQVPYSRWDFQGRYDSNTVEAFILGGLSGASAAYWDFALEIANESAAFVIKIRYK